MAMGKVHVLISAFLLIHRGAGVVHPDGISKVSRYQDELGNYEFGYTVSNSEGEHFHKSEKDSLGRVVGSYGLTGGDGRQRIVDYVADHNGFRAHVRSNEPGVVSSSSADATIENTGSGNVAPISHVLDFAASSDSASSKFGDRLKETSSRVTYSRPGEDEQYRSDRRIFRLVNITRGAAREGERRQGHELSGEKRLSAGPEFVRERLAELPQTRAELRSVDSPVFERYQPPIDPFSSGQLVAPLLNPPRQHRYRQEPVQPSTPPYGGIETRSPLLDPNLFARYSPVTEYPARNRVTRPPVISMSTIHGGIGDMPYLLNPTSPRTPASRSRTVNFPPSPSNSREDFIDPRYRSISHANDIGRRANLPPKNLVLRAVAIPNGIQAVHVDPATGEVYHSQEYPMYNPGEISYDDEDDSEKFGERSRGISHGKSLENPRNSDFSDERLTRSRQPFIPLQPPPQALRSVAGNPNNYSFASLPSSYNHRNRGQSPDSFSLSKPSAKDLHVISRVFDHVNQRYNARPPAVPVRVAHPPSPHPVNDIPYLRDSRPDYPRAAMHHSNGEFDFDDFKSGLDTRFGPRELKSIFPLTFDREPFGPDYSRFGERPLSLNRGYRHVESAPQDPSVTTPSSAVRSDNYDSDSSSK